MQIAVCNFSVALCLESTSVSIMISTSLPAHLHIEHIVNHNHHSIDPRRWCHDIWIVGWIDGCESRVVCLLRGFCFLLVVIIIFLGVGFFVFRWLFILFILVCLFFSFLVFFLVFLFSLELLSVSIHTLSSAGAGPSAGLAFFFFFFFFSPLACNCSANHLLESIWNAYLES